MLAAAIQVEQHICQDVGHFLVLRIGALLVDKPADRALNSLVSELILVVRSWGSYGF
jgi:hypothetical protein